jgi:glycosyltransferase involved in cell wall biosynthesis
MISVIIPAYNRYLITKKAIESVLKQNIQSKIECLIIDDFSSDNSYENLVLEFSRIESIRFFKNQCFKNSFRSDVQRVN